MFYISSYRLNYFFQGFWEEVEGKTKRVENVEIEIKFCKEAENGLWGGETIVHGYKYPKNGKVFGIVVLFKGIGG